MKFKGEVVLIGTVEVEAANPQEARDRLRGLFGHEFIDLGSSVRIDDCAVLSGNMRRNGMLSNHVAKLEPSKAADIGNGDLSLAV